MRKVLLLGASGSIGTQSLDILEKDPSNFLLTGFSVGHQVDKIPGILARFPSVQEVCVQEESDYETLSKQYPSLHWHFGSDGLVELIESCPCDMVENALMGFSGLVPSLRALQADKILCLANKESLVVGGELIQKELAKGHGRLYPIDSEHVAIAKLLSCVKREHIDKVLITASGGAFRTLKREELTHVTPEMALNHPTWKMGPKITVDCATMMNKGFEVIEAAVLFHLPVGQIEILLHDESHVHSLLLLKDGTYLADVSAPDMHGPIAYALYESHVPFKPTIGNSLAEIGPYHFHPFDGRRYPAPKIALDAYRTGGTATATLNAADEVAVSSFLKGQLPFLEIEEEVKHALAHLPVIQHPSLRQILEADSYARLFVSRHIASKQSL